MDTAAFAILCPLQIQALMSMVRPLLTTSPPPFLPSSLPRVTAPDAPSCFAGMMANVPDRADGPLTQRSSGQSDVYAYAHIRTGTYRILSLAALSVCAAGSARLYTDHRPHGPGPPGGGAPWTEIYG